MAYALSFDHLAEFDQLPRTPASDVKKLGWRGVLGAPVALDGQVRAGQGH